MPATVYSSQLYKLVELFIPLVPHGTLIHSAGSEVHLVSKSNFLIPLPTAVPSQHGCVWVVFGLGVGGLVLELASCDDRQKKA